VFGLEVDDPVFGDASGGEEAGLKAEVRGSGDVGDLEHEWRRRGVFVRVCGVGRHAGEVGLWLGA
jgi:hypothetical protein